MLHTSRKDKPKPPKQGGHGGHKHKDTPSTVAKGQAKRHVLDIRRRWSPGQVNGTAVDALYDAARLGDAQRRVAGAFLVNHAINIINFAHHMAADPTLGDRIPQANAAIIMPPTIQNMASTTMNRPRTSRGSTSQKNVKITGIVPPTLCGGSVNRQSSSIEA